MAWRKPELRDLAAKLSQKELDLFRQHPDFETAADPVRDLLELTAESVRGFCRTNKQLKMSPELGTIPESLVGFAMDMAAYDVVTRIKAGNTDDRKGKWEKALEWMEKVATGAYTPESWSKDGEAEMDAESNRARPNFGGPRRFILNEYL